MPTLMSFLRGRSPVNVSDVLRGSLGALLGIVVTGALVRLMAGGGLTGKLMLVPPIGASAVLVFAVPASPLAQPRSVIGGNILAAVVGVTCALLIPYPLVAAGVAVAVAIAVMSLLGCLHPPGGAIALGAALSAATAGVASYAQIVTPVALCSVVLVLAGVAYVNLTGRSYPHRVKAPATAHATNDVPPARRLGYTAADLDAALAQYGELLDVSREDLDALFQQAELQAHRRIHSHITCADIMSRDVISLDVDQTTESGLLYLQKHDLWIAPVIDVQRRVVGMVRRGQLIGVAGRKIGAVLDPLVHKVRPGEPIETLLPLLSSGATHEAMVVDQDRVLLGVITQTDLLAVLYRAHIVEAVVSQAA